MEYISTSAEFRSVFFPGSKPEPEIERPDTVCIDAAVFASLLKAAAASRNIEGEYKTIN